MIETIPFTTTDAWLQARTLDLTSTESPALFGVSPYVTEFELFHRKRERVAVALEENERVKWGTRLQDAIAQGICEEQGWSYRRMPEYLRLPELRLGASFDFAAWADNEQGWWPLETKNVDALIFKENWLIDKEAGTVEGPPHIEIQVQHQLLVSGRPFAYLGALVGGNRVVLQRRDANPRVQDAIRKRAAAFWARVEHNDPPTPNFDRDAAFIIALHQFAEPEKVFDARTDPTIETLVQEYHRQGEEARKAEKAREILKAHLLTKIGEAETVLLNSGKISAGMVGACPIKYTRPAYRNFRFYPKKETPNG